MIAVYRNVLLVALAVVLGGCGMFGKKDPERDPMELTDIDERLKVSKLWSTSTGSGLGKSAPGLMPFHIDGEIWTADHKGRLTVIDAASGDRLRRFDLEMDLSAGPTVVGQRVLLGTMNGQILVLDRNTGAIDWRAQLSSEILAPPLQRDGVIVVRCIDGRVFGLNADTGLREWVYDRSVPLLTLRGNSAPVIRGGQVFVGHDDGALTALSLADGQLLWEQRVGTPEGRTQLDRLADIDGHMEIVGLDIYAISEHDRMASVALDSGRLLWVKEVGSNSGLTVARTQMVLADSEDRIWMLDRRSGSTGWSNEQLLRRGLSRPVLQGGFVAVADKEGYVHWLDADTGEFVARERASKDAPAGAPLVVGNVLFVLDVDGKLSAWRVGASS
ncbi:MAG: outer membrane protein assembly factor BamB [Xanthomonadales bacterium]|nr:outer membrane protein assembly factor BamB [Xanthomonadales bacterium]|tara:strand:- start:335 stop:1495 length:1161 start_codon:yes stop_codon:yes gene_type:complete